jgi:hypothetical protein
MNNDDEFRSENFELMYHGNGILKMRLRGFIKFAQIPATATRINEFIHKNQVKYLLVDQRELKVLTKDVQEHILRSIAEMQRMGIERVGILDPVDVFAKAGISKVHQESKDTTFDTKHFQTEEECMEWFVKSTM